MSVTRGTFEQGRSRASGVADTHRAARVADETERELVPLPDANTAFLALATTALALFVLTQVSIALERESDLLLRFDTGNEATVATWFSSAMWLTATGLAFAIGSAARRLGKASARGWLLVSGLFALLALDETGQLHEETVGPLMDAVERVTGLSDTPAKLLAVACVLALLAALAVWLWPWLRALPGELRLHLTLAGTLFVGGSLGLEVVSRLYASRYLSPFEELFEMLGVALLVAALLPFVRAVLATPPAAHDDRAPAG